MTDYHENFNFVIDRVMDDCANDSYLGLLPRDIKDEIKKYHAKRYEYYDEMDYYEVKYLLRKYDCMIRIGNHLYKPTGIRCVYKDYYSYPKKYRHIRINCENLHRIDIHLYDKDIEVLNTDGIKRYEPMIILFNGKFDKMYSILQILGVMMIFALGCVIIENYNKQFPSNAGMVAGIFAEILLIVVMYHNIRKDYPSGIVNVMISEIKIMCKDSGSQGGHEWYYSIIDWRMGSSNKISRKAN